MQRAREERAAVADSRPGKAAPRGEPGVSSPGRLRVSGEAVGRAARGAAAGVASPVALGGRVGSGPGQPELCWVAALPAAGVGAGWAVRFRVALVPHHIV